VLVAAAPGCVPESGRGLNRVRGASHSRCCFPTVVVGIDAAGGSDAVVDGVALALSGPPLELDLAVHQHVLQALLLR